LLLSNKKSVNTKFMKIQTTIKWAAAIAAVCLAVPAASAQNMVGVNFVDNDSTVGPTPGGVQNGYDDSLLTNEIAGVFPQANWNNLGRYGDGIPLNGNDGLPSGITIAWYSAGMWSCNAGLSGPVPQPIFPSPNDKLMDAFLDCTWADDGPNTSIPPGTAVTNITGNGPIICLSGLQQFVANQCGGPYSIVVYISDTVQSAVCEVWCQTVTGPSTAIVPGVTNTPQYWIIGNANAQCNWSNFTQVPLSSTNLPNIACGNYILFSGLTNDEILIRTQNNGEPAASVNGIQIIALGVRLPPTLSVPIISPTNVVYLGTTATISDPLSVCGTPSYQWQTDGGGGGSLTNIPDATNSSVVTTPTTTGIWNYDVIVTNVYGAITSSVVSLTVLPASAPIITQDTGTADFGPVTNLFAFVGGSVNFYANFGLGTLPITNQWLVKLDSGGDYAPVGGGASSAWTFANVQSSSAGYYELAATNAVGRSNSTPTHLTALADPAAPTVANSGIYAYCVYTNHPWAYWKFEETNDTFFSSMQAYDYSGHNFDATYGNSITGDMSTGCFDGGENLVNNGLYGPCAACGYPGFVSGNTAAGLQANVANGNLTVPPLNLNTNAVTFMMWINPNTPEPIIPANVGLLYNRNGTDAAGVGFSSHVNMNGTASLGYTWNNNSAATYGWDSGLYPVGQTWQMVTYVITPQNTTIYLYYVGGGQTNMFKAVNNVANASEAFGGGTTWIGGDNWDIGRTFDGSIDEVAVFTNAMSENQIVGLFLKALGSLIPPPPPLPIEPTNTTIFQNQTLQLTCVAFGIPAPNYQWWYENGTSWGPLDLAPGRTPNGSTLYWTNYTSLTISNFMCVATNIYGGVTSSVATVTVIPINRFTNGWTVNFNAMSGNNLGPNVPYAGHGILGNGTYWNGVSGGNFANTQPSRWDDGITPCPITVSATNFNGSWSSGPPFDNVLLDEYMKFGTNGTAIIFTNVPPGRYNLALYGICGSYANRGTTFTVQGVSQSVINAQDTLLKPDNTVFYTNLLVTSGTLEVDMAPGNTPAQAPDAYGRYTEGDLAGAQLQVVTGPVLVSMTNNLGMGFALTYFGGYVLQSTNMAGPWTTNTTVGQGTITINPTGTAKFYRVWTNKNY
jgi:hypothetical protein